MKYLVLILTMLMVACGQDGGAPAPVQDDLDAEDPIVGLPDDDDDGGDDDEVPPVAATPTPSPTPSPTPFVYTCANHPLTGKTIKTVVNERLWLYSDCTFKVNYVTHYTWGTWSPNPDPKAVKKVTAQVYLYPLTLSPGGAYVCLPADGPQTCSNTGWAGGIKIEYDTKNPNATSIIWF